MCIVPREPDSPQHLHRQLSHTGSGGDLDFSLSSGMDHLIVMQLAQYTWIASRHHILIPGLTRSGKSYLASALGIAAVRPGFAMRRHRTSRILHTLTLARQEVH